MIGSYMSICIYVFFFNDTTTTEIYTLSLHDALPILAVARLPADEDLRPLVDLTHAQAVPLQQGRQLVAELRAHVAGRSEEHTSEIQSRQYLVCRPLL